MERDTSMGIVNDGTREGEYGGHRVRKFSHSVLMIMYPITNLFDSPLLRSFLSRSLALSILALPVLAFL